MLSDGKLVRDLIPDIIRESGRQPEIRYLSGDDLLKALCAKLCEEAQEVSEAANNREQLIAELADLNEVIAALTELQDIDDQVLMKARIAKAEQRGRFERGTWLVSPVPAAVRKFHCRDVDDQRVEWLPERWIELFAGHESAYAALIAHSREAGGIARSFVHAHSHGNPVALFLMTMAWGHGRRGYGPNRTKAILSQDDAPQKLGAIVEATRTDGAEAGWRALLGTHKIKGLNMSFGTKLLYFAGYTTNHRPRPLILDEKVRAGLAIVAPGTVPPRGRVTHRDYLRYLELAEDWAAEPTFGQSPDVVEYGLFVAGA